MDYYTLLLLLAMHGGCLTIIYVSLRKMGFGWTPIALVANAYYVFLFPWVFFFFQMRTPGDEAIATMCALPIPSLVFLFPKMYLSSWGE
jgi:hypothetical protein